MVLLLVPLFLQDTVRLDAAAALARAMERAPAIVAADARLRAATFAARDAGRLRNPQLGVAAENLGMQRQVTGKDGLAGTEGQITLQTVLPLGGDLGAARRGADAQTALAASDATIARAELQGQLLRAIAAHQQQHRVLAAATAESEALDRFAAAMTARAADGRASGGEAARVRTEAVLVASQLARRHAALAVADAWLATALDYPASTPLRIDAPAQCEASGTGAAIDLQRARAKFTLAEAMASQAGARRVPDLIPQVGFRRTAGFSGVLVGVAMDLPLFSSGGNGVAAARAEAEAAAADVGQAERDLAAVQSAEQRASAALRAVGARYGADWERDLAQAVTAAEARWQEGQGTLAELFDARRVRLAAIDEHASWRERVLANRVQLARALGAPLTASLLLDDCPGATR
jgi:outer membrane protein, heavy metal efflux system